VTNNPSAAAASLIQSIAIEEDSDDEEDEDEEETLTEAQRDIRNFHKEFDELIVWLNRALDQHNNKQARRLCETIEKRDKPLRAKYTDHPEAKDLIDALNKVLSRYYKVTESLSFSLTLLHLPIHFILSFFSMLFFYSLDPDTSLICFSFSFSDLRKWKELLAPSNSKRRRKKRKRSHLIMTVRKGVRTTRRRRKGLARWTCSLTTTSFAVFERKEREEEREKDRSRD
jgi:hypothetical protein